MGVKLHGVTHNIGNLVKPPVVKQLHRVEYASLHGFESVIDMRDGTLQYHIARIVEKPALEHASQFMTHHIVGGVYKYSRVFIVAHGIIGFIFTQRYKKIHEISLCYAKVGVISFKLFMINVL